MKIKGKSLVTVPSTLITLSRPGGEFELTVSAHSPGLSTRLQSVGLTRFPSAPQKVLKNGNVPWKKGDGSVQYYRDDDDPAYVAESFKVMARLQAVKLADALRNDPSVEFDAKRPSTNDPKEWLAYADALVAEVNHEQNGFLQDEIDKIMLTAAGARVEVDSEEGVDRFLGEDDPPQGAESDPS